MFGGFKTMLCKSVSRLKDYHMVQECECDVQHTWDVVTGTWPRHKPFTSLRYGSAKSYCEPAGPSTNSTTLVSQTWVIGFFFKETETPRMMLEPMVSNQDIPLHRYTHLFMVDLGWFLLQFWTPPCWVLWDMSEPRSGPGLREQWAQLGAQRRSRVHEYNKIPERSERLEDAALHHSLYSFKFSQPHPGIPNSSEISTRTVETHVTTHVNDCKRWLISKITGRFLELPGVHRCGHPWPDV